MLYVKDSNILTLKQLLTLMKVMRAEPPRPEDLEEWGAYELQPDNPPVGDVVQPLKTASQAADGLWYRDYAIRSYTAEEQLANAKIVRMSDRYAPIEVDGLLYDADALAQDNINGAIDNWMILTSAAGKDTLTWTLATNIDIEVTFEMLLAVKQALVLRVAMLHEEYKALKSQLLN